MMELKMSTVVMGTVVIDNRDQKVWTFTGKDSKVKTIMMIDETGYERHFGLSTVNKNFDIKEQEPETVHIDITGKEGMIDCTAMQEELEEQELEQKETKAKKERKLRQKKERTADVSALLDFILTEWEKMGIVKIPAKENALFRPLCAENGRQVIKLMWTTKKISFFVRVEAATAHAEQWQKINYAMPFQCMFFHDTEETRQNIKDIFQLVLNADSIRPKKEKKTKKDQETA